MAQSSSYSGITASEALHPIDEDDCLEIPTVDNLACVAADVVMCVDRADFDGYDSVCALVEVSLSERLRSVVIVGYMLEQDDETDPIVRNVLRRMHRELRKEQVEGVTQTMITGFLLENKDLI